MRPRVNDEGRPEGRPQVREQGLDRSQDRPRRGVRQRFLLTDERRGPRLSGVSEKNPAAVALGQLSALKRKKAAGSEDEFRKQMGSISKAWKDMSAEERSAELSRRRKLGLKKGKRGGGRKAKVAANTGNDAQVKGSKLQKAS